MLSDLEGDIWLVSAEQLNTEIARLRVLMHLGYQQWVVLGNSNMFVW